MLEYQSHPRIHVDTQNSSCGRHCSMYYAIHSSCKNRHWLNDPINSVSKTLKMEKTLLSLNFKSFAIKYIFLKIQTWKNMWTWFEFDKGWFANLPQVSFDYYVPSLWSWCFADVFRFFFQFSYKFYIFHKHTTCFIYKNENACFKDGKET